MTTVDYLIIGSGITGATLARTLTDAGRECLVLERRPQLGGNVADRTHPSGIRYHQYGPHYFRTSCDRLWEWVQRFSPFYPFEARVQTCVGTRFYPWPLQPQHRHLWDRAVNDYNLKMWGTTTPPQEVQDRVEVRQPSTCGEPDDRLKTDRHQGLPTLGYSGWVNNILAGIPVELGCDYLKYRHEYRVRHKVIFTGPIDEYYGFDLGRLAYRAQNRDLVYSDHQVQVQPCVQVNHPGLETPWLRSVEWNHLMVKPSWRMGSLRTLEMPYSPIDPDRYEYPVNDEVNKTLYKRYRQRADADEKLIVAGRLGTFKYADMDACIGSGLKLARQLLEESP